MWKVYVDEADRYDRALVASWKGDMNGMLIFVRSSFYSLPCHLMLRHSPAYSPQV